MLVLTKSVLANPHLDSKVRVAQALSKEGLSITKNLLAELALLSIGSFTLMPFFQECCKIAAVCFISDFFIQITLFTPFYSLLVQRIKKRNINAYPKKHPQNVYPRNIYARPGEPVQQKTPKRLRFILFLARLRLVQRGFILLLSACIGLAIYNAYIVLEQTTTPMETTILNQKQTIKPNLTMIQKSESESDQVTDNFIPVTTINETVLIDKNSQKSFMKLLEINKISAYSKDEKETINSSSPPPTINPYHRLGYSSRDNLMTKPFANQHWTNLFSLYNISLAGRFISILPPIFLAVPITPERAKLCRNAFDSDYYTLKKFIPMKFSNGEYVIRDDDD
ncbi:hypothetical protein BLA29_001406 [Euroglyphus maynei]|uniref:SSD domain-containing protein n=1 Tax=Euroglyphus maynei TaxID=6958 RepID=A0A1Y3BMV3_EURMA|nr:hypothetical protein BLA29_001406 [Euroglyphus maynei]